MVPITGHEILANYIVPKSKLADTDIRQLEERIGAELPFDYRALLEKYNGGYLKVNVAFPIARIRDVSWLHMLYGLGEIDPAYSLIESLDVLPELSHLRLLPVGNDPFMSIFSPNPSMNSLPRCISILSGNPRRQRLKP